MRDYFNNSTVKLKEREYKKISTGWEKTGETDVLSTRADTQQDGDRLRKLRSDEYIEGGDAIIYLQKKVSKEYVGMKAEVSFDDGTSYTGEVTEANKLDNSLLISYD